MNSVRRAVIAPPRQCDYLTALRKLHNPSSSRSSDGPIWKTALQLLDEAVGCGASSSKSRPKFSVPRQLFDATLLACRDGGIQELLSRAEKCKATFSTRSATSIMASLTCYRSALDLFFFMHKKKKIDEVFLLETLSILRAANVPYERCLNLLQNARADGLLKNAKCYNTVLSLPDVGLKEVCRIIDWMRQDRVETTARTYTIVLTKLGDLDEVTLSCDLVLAVVSSIQPELYANGTSVGILLQQIVSLAERNKCLDAHVLTAGIRACGRALCYEDALQLFDRYGQQFGDGHCRNATITACAKSGMWWQALSLLQPLPSRTLTLEEKEVIRVGYNSALSACEKAGQYREAIRLLEQLRDSSIGADRISYNCTISSCEKAGECQSAVRLLSNMLQSGISPDDVTLSAVLLSTSHGSGQWRSALRILLPWRRGLWPIANVHSDLQAHRPPTPTASAYTAVIAACATAGRHEEIFCLLKDMTKLRLQKDAFTLHSCVQALETSAPRDSLAKQLWLGQQAGRVVTAFTSDLQTEKVGENEHGIVGDARRRLTRSRLLTACARLDGSNSPIFKSPSSFTGVSSCSRTDVPIYVKDSLHQVLDSTLLQEEELGAVQNALRALRRVLSCVVKEKFHLKLLGSHAEGMAFSGGDIDLTILFPTNSLPSDGGPQLRAFRQNLVRTLRSNIPLACDTHGTALKVLGAVFTSRAPILQLEHESVRIDLTVENRLPVRKAQLIRKLAGRRYLPFLRLVKSWAMSRNIYGQRAGFPSGFAFTTLALFYLQLRGHIPSLTACTQMNSEVKGSKQDSLSDIELLDFLVGFFDYYANQHDWVHGVVSLQVGQVCRRPTPSVLDSENLETTMKLYVVDPLEGPGVDLAGPYLTIGRQEKLRTEFKRAHQLCTQVNLDLKSLLSKP